MSSFQFVHPNYLWLLLLVPLFAYWIYTKRKAYYPSFQLPHGQKAFDAIPVSSKVKALVLLPMLRLLAYAFIVIALARPQMPLSEKEINTEGIDIVISLDISASMLARDFQPDRLEAAKKVAKQFIENRRNDRIGLVIFAGESFTQCPITIDHKVLVNLFDKIHSGMVEDGTAIGMGLATAVSRLKESPSKSKVIILMTDGVNNAGYVDPGTAIELAKAHNIRVYTIGIGKNGMAPYPVQDAQGRKFYQNIKVQIDESLLRKIATQTGGAYFRATGNDKLKTVYEKIDKLEKSKIKISNYDRKKEIFFWFAGLALLCLLIEMILRYTYLRTIVI